MVLCYVSSVFNLYLLKLLNVISNYQLVAFENHLFPWEYDRTGSLMQPGILGVYHT